MAIVLLTFAAYLPALWAGFVWDDADHVPQAPIQRTLTALKWVWIKLGATPQYYPLTHTTFWLESHLWGLNPAGYHAVNIVLQAANAILLWRILRGLGLPGAWLAAAVFAVHPVNVESVAWITERKNTLSAFFYLLAFLAALKAWGLDIHALSPSVKPAVRPVFQPPENTRDRQGTRSVRKGLESLPVAPPFRAVFAGLKTPPGRAVQRKDLRLKADSVVVASEPAIPVTAYALCLLCFIAAVLSKTVTCSFPAALALVLWWKNGRVKRRDWLLLAPLFAIALAAAKLTSGMEQWNVGAKGPEFAFSLAQRLLIAGRAIWFYFGKLLWPAKLAFIYPRWEINPPAAWQWIFPAGVVAAIGILWIFRKRIGRGPLAAVLFFVGTLFPALGFVNVYPMRFSFVADHFQYLAEIGLIALAVSIAAKIPLPSKARYALAALTLGAMVCLSFHQTLSYRNSTSLWLDTLKKNKNCWLAMDNLGAEAEQRGDLAEATKWLDRALATHPDQREAHLALGRIFETKKEWNAAAEQFSIAMKMRPDDSAQADHEMALLQLARGDAIGAMEWYEKTLAQEPHMEPARLEFAKLLLRNLNRPQAAEDQYQRALELNPDSVGARTGLAAIRFRQGDVDRAIALMAEAVEIDPSNGVNCSNYGTMLMQAGRTTDAEEQFRRAIEDDPDLAQAYDGLGSTLAAAGKNVEAARMYRQALAVNPGFTPAREHLAGLAK